jgi:hypothetical protein
MLKKDREREDPEADDASVADDRREASSLDFGCFPLLGGTGNEWMWNLERQEVESASGSESEDDLEGEGEVREEAMEAERYLREVVYGGWLGYAWARSVGEFCSQRRGWGDGDEDEVGALVDHWS